jgi:hypothetical protein
MSLIWGFQWQMGMVFYHTQANDFYLAKTTGAFPGKWKIQNPRRIFQENILSTYNPQRIDNYEK